MPCSMQYCRRSSSRVEGVTVGRGLCLVVVRFGVGVVASRSVVRCAVGFCVGRWVARVFLGAVVCGAGGGVAVVRRTTGGVVLIVALDDGVSSTNFTAAASSDLPSNRPIAKTAQRLTPANTRSAAAPAYTARRDGAPYLPIGPFTGLPRPLTQNRQPAGAGGQDGSGRQVFGGIQLRRGVHGQFGGTTNRFRTTPPPRPTRPPHRGQRHKPAAGYLQLPYAPACRLSLQLEHFGEEGGQVFAEGAVGGDWGNDLVDCLE